MAMGMCGPIAYCPFPIASSRTILRMAKRSAFKIRFSATLLSPQRSNGKPVSWTFLTLPKASECEAPLAGSTPNGSTFRATLEPDGQGGHWFKVDRKLRESSGADVGDAVTLEITPVTPDQEPGTQSAGRSAESPRSRAENCGGGGVGHHADRAARLDSLDHLRQASRDSRAPDQDCLRHAGQRQATPLLLRSVRDVWQEHELPRRRRPVKHF